jgi:dolichol-phosphate mannosyltransferase
MNLLSNILDIEERTRGMANTSPHNITYSVVIPLKNEEENVRELIEELEPVMNVLNTPWELICIDDGSTDKTSTILTQLALQKKYLRVLTFAKNFGQSSAFDAGFKHARGQYVITLDGDRQNDPHDIPKLLTLIEGSDLVCGQRTKRKDPPGKRIISKLANAVRSTMCKDGIKDTGCSLKVYRSDCLKNIKLFDGMHRFLPALFQMHGYRVKEIPVNHRERKKGQSKYHFFNRSFNTVFDMFAVMWMRRRALKYHLKQEH